MKVLSRSRSLMGVSAGVLALLAAACATPDRIASPSLTAIDASALNNTSDITPGSLRVCKVSGPAGEYTFNVSSQGGGTSFFNNNPTFTLAFDGTTPVCKIAWMPFVHDGSWDSDPTAQVTVSEAVPAGMSVEEIQVWKPFGTYQYSVFGTNTITVSIQRSDLIKLHFYNIDNPPPPPPVLATCFSITAVRGVAIAPVQLSASGGMGGPYTFSASGLPAGITLSSSGLLSGTPTVTGTFGYTVTATDDDGNSGTSNCEVKVDEPPPVVATCQSINAVQGVAITPVQLSASGGTGGPYTFSATGLPAGLTLSSSGLLSGTPSVTGSFTYTVTVTDNSGNTGTTSCSVVVKQRFSGETAVGAGYRYPNTSNWFMYSPYKTTKIDLIAGQHYDAGDIFMSRTSTATVIRIVLQNGFTWAEVAENLKIQPFLNAPTNYVQPGAFQYKFTVSGNTVTVTIPGTSAKFYGIHGDVMRPLP